MAVVIQRTDPLSAASDAVGSYYAAKRQKQLEDAAAAHQAAREGRQDMESDRSYGIQQSDLGLRQAAGAREEALQPGALKLQTGQIAQQGAELSLTQVQTLAAKNDADYQTKVRPLQLQLAALQNKLTTGQITSQQAATAHQQLENQIAQVEAAHAQTKATLDEAQQRASIAATNASANASNASAYREMHPIGPRESVSERAQDTFDTSISSLSPQGQSFLDMISNTNNPPTRLQSLAALQQANIPASDKNALRNVLMSRELQFETSGQQQNQDFRAGRADVTDKHYDESRADRNANANFNAIRNSPQFKALNLSDRSLLEASNRAYGIPDTRVHLQNIIDGKQASNITPEQAQRLLNALQ